MVSQAADFLQTLSVDIRVALGRSVSVEYDLVSGIASEVTCPTGLHDEMERAGEQDLFCSTLLY